LSELFGEEARAASLGGSGGGEALIFDSGDAEGSRAQAASNAPALVVDGAEAAAVPEAVGDEAALIVDDELDASARDEIDRLNALFYSATPESSAGAEENLIIDDAGGVDGLFDFNAVETQQIDSGELSRAMAEAKTAAEPEAAVSDAGKTDATGAVAASPKGVTGDDIENRLNELFPGAPEAG